MEQIFFKYYLNIDQNHNIQPKYLWRSMKRKEIEANADEAL